MTQTARRQTRRWAVLFAGLWMQLALGVAEGRPNLLIWVIDDAGFADIGPYGGLTDTPGLDQLAAGGLRYVDFHVTAVCSSTRASLLTGRNHHAVGMGAHALGPAAHPGYTARIPASAGSLARVLRDAGWATYALGKWDQLPPEETGPSGPFTLWPSGQGFEHFYGFLAAASDHFKPLLYDGHEPVDPGSGRDDYHLTTDLVDRGLDWYRNLRAVDPSRPFFMYFASGAVHSPHQAPEAWLKKYRGRFSDGWDALRPQVLERQVASGVVPETTVLSQRPAGVPAWGSLSPLDRQVQARAMEAYAAQLDHADHEFGRLIAALKAAGEFDNTIVVVLSDNGASAEGGPYGQHNITRYPNGLPSDPQANAPYLDRWGGPDSYPQTSAGWATLSNTPFSLFKQTVHEGGTRVPLIISWPSGIADAGGIRPQFHHVNDLMPTLLSMAGVEPPAVLDGVVQQPFNGIDMSYSFRGAEVPGRKGPQYFEMFGNRAIRMDGWKAVTAHQPEPWILQGRRELSEEGWELYDLGADFNDVRDRSGTHPERLEQLRGLFQSEAERNQVFPLLPDRLAHMRELAGRVRQSHRGRFEYFPGGSDQRIPEWLAPPTKSDAHRIEVELTRGADAAGMTGVLVAAGGKAGGYALYLLDGVLTYGYNLYGEVQTRIRAARPLQGTDQVLSASLVPLGNGAFQVGLYIDGEEVASGRIGSTIPRLYSLTESFDVGNDSGTLVMPDYASSPRLAGIIQRVVVSLAYAE